MPFLIPNKIEQYLATLSKTYALDGEREKAELIVNGRIRIEEATDQHSDFDETYVGHTLYFSIPEVLFLRTYKRRNELERDIQTDLNDLARVSREYIDTVRLEMDVKDTSEWRRESGLFLTGEKLITQDQESRIWEKSSFRLFVSHRSRVKDYAKSLRDELKSFGISAFVAHEMIKPTREWLIEIENALASMDGFVALMTNDFHDSDWTDQEVGYAFGRGVPIVAVRVERDPYGFLGKFQGLSAKLAGKVETAKEIASLFMRQPSMLEAYITAIENCSDSNVFDKANSLSSVLFSIESLDRHQVIRLMNAFNSNSDVNGSYGFNGEKSKGYGGGLPEHLTRITGDKYILTSKGEIALQST